MVEKHSTGDKTMDTSELIRLAQLATEGPTGLRRLKEDWKYMGYVGAALLSTSGRLYTGVNLELYCGIGFCAEHSAVAEMVKNGETQVATMVAVTNDGVILPPCGRCRELLYQMDIANLDTDVVMDIDGSTSKLGELLPHNWQPRIGI